MIERRVRILRTISKIILSTFLIVIMLVPLFSAASSYSSSFIPSATTGSVQPQQSGGPSSPVFVWLFGYVGNTFYPQTQLGISQQQVVSEVKNLSSQIGASRLELVTVDSQTPGNVFNSTTIPLIKQFDDNLTPYASVVYGRIDLLQFNLASKTSIWTEVSEYVNQLDLNGLWLDHASVYYGKIGASAFNNMMQNMTNNFPKLHYIMNHTYHRVLITPAKGTTWENMTYVSPSTKSNLSVNKTLVALLNARFPGHVLVHFDAFARSSYEPMGRFADLTSAKEVSTLLRLQKNGVLATNQSLAYTMLFPVIGAWTYRYSQYKGTLYNSLTFGTYNRSTVANFTTIMEIGVRPTFVWLYGYIGDYFYPQTNNSLTPQNLISAAANISKAVGGPSRVRLVSPVDEEPGHNIQPQMISTIKQFVSNLSLYSSVIYGRLDLLEFNTTTKVSLYSQVSLYVNQLGLQGIWFDHGPYLWGSMGATAFNNMMQNLSDSFPGIQFIMNTAANTHNYIRPLKGYTWGLDTWISPTVTSGTYESFSMTEVEALNAIYPGQVLLHWDAFAISKTASMGVFADQTTEVETNAVNYLAINGSKPASLSQAYDLIYPVVGSWTWDGSMYKGTLYNSLTTGTYARGTVYNFTKTMVATQFGLA